MKQKMLLRVIGFFCGLTLWHSSLQAQVTHGLGFQVGLTQVMYKSQLAGRPNFSSHFLPSFTFEYGKFSDNLFWGGLGVGVTPRIIPFYKYPNYTKIGIQGPEFQARVRAGFKIQRDFMTHLPYIGLGAGYFVYDSEFSSGQGYSIGGNYNATYSVRKPLPFIEIGNTLLNTTFRENKRSVFISFFVRYYLVDIFSQPISFEYDPFMSTSVQYRMIEFVLAGGLQRNWHKD